MAQRAACAVLLVLLQLACAVAFAMDVCRLPSFDGMRHRTDTIRALLGPSTTDVRKIRIFVSSEQGVSYIQSNFRSADPDRPGKFSEHTTKLRTDKVRNLETALQNIIFWEKPPADWESIVKTALVELEVLVDPRVIDHNGRTAIDLAGAKTIHLATDTQTLQTGQIDVLPLKTPPPALVERISGCCFKGRPPGRSREILKSLSTRTIRQDSLALLSLVVDTGTNAVISDSPILRQAQNRTSASSTDPWPGQIDKAFAAARGSTLIVLSHIEGPNAVVLSPSGHPQFSIPLSQLRQRANSENVDLILFGCDTAAFINENSMGLGVAGKYNTVTAVERLQRALATSKTAAELLEATASEDINLVVYDQAGGNGYVGASGFAKVNRSGIFSRVFRVLFSR